MKIYFDGDSWMNGVGLDEEHRLSQRFSALISKELGAEEYNVSEGSKSNNRMIRHLLLGNDISQYDLAIIQMTYPFRSEYYDKRWKTTSATKHRTEFWRQYYKEVYNETYGSTSERIFAMNIRDHCKANKVKLILVTNNFHTKVKFDLQLQIPKYPQFGHRNNHPTDVGHRLIADDIMRLI